MEVQDFAPQHLVAQLALRRRNPAIIDRRGAIALAMSDHLGMGHTSLEPTAAEIKSEDGRDQFRIGFAQVLASILSFEDFDEAVRGASDFFGMALEVLDHPPVKRVVAHTSDIAAVDSFDALRDSLARAFIPRLDGLNKAVGVDLTDAGWTFVHDDAESMIEVNVGPMEEKQLRDVLDDEISTYPPSLLFLDVKTMVRVKEGETSALDLWANAVERNRSIVERLSGWLKELINDA